MHGFINVSQLVEASHQHHKITGSNPAEVMNFSGFSVHVDAVTNHKKNVLNCEDPTV